MNLTKSYVAAGVELEVQLTYINSLIPENDTKILNIYTYHKGEKIPLCTFNVNALREDLVKDNPFFNVVSQIILDIPKAENALKTISNGWTYKDH